MFWKFCLGTRQKIGVFGGKGHSFTAYPPPEKFTDLETPSISQIQKHPPLENADFEETSETSTTSISPIKKTSPILIHWFWKHPFFHPPHLQTNLQQTHHSKNTHLETPFFSPTTFMCKFATYPLLQKHWFRNTLFFTHHIYVQICNLPTTPKILISSTYIASFLSIYITF